MRVIKGDFIVMDAGTVLALLASQMIAEKNAADTEGEGRVIMSTMDTEIITKRYKNVSSDSVRMKLEIMLGILKLQPTFWFESD